MNAKNLSPNDQFMAFAKAMNSFALFQRTDDRRKGHRIWGPEDLNERKKPGMYGYHSKLDKKLRDRSECLLIQRCIDWETNIEPCFSIQLTTFNREPGVLKTEVHVRCLDYPQRMPPQDRHVSFTFRKDDRLGGYLLEIRRDEIKEWLQQAQKPMWLSKLRSSGSKFELGGQIDGNLIHKLLLFADLVAQIAEGNVKQRDPAKFFPPKEAASSIGLNDVNLSGGTINPRRGTSEVSRVIRATWLSAHVGSLHNGQCQICGETFQMPSGKNYSETHHLKPLGRPHNGPDISENMLCVCPNHHAQLDCGAIDLTLANLRTHPSHSVKKSYINYHNQEVFCKGLKADEEMCDP